MRGGMRLGLLLPVLLLTAGAAEVAENTAVVLDSAGLGRALRDAHVDTVAIQGDQQPLVFLCVCASQSYRI